MAALKPKQEAFVQHYLESFDATKAAMAIGFARVSASQRGYEYRHNPLVAARISEELSNKGLPPDAILLELRDLIKSPDTRFSTTRYDPNTGDPIEVRVDLNPKVKALELYGKAHGLFTEKVDLSGSLTSKIELVGVSEDDI